MILQNKAPLIEGLAFALQLKPYKQGFIGNCPLCGYCNAFSIVFKQDKTLLYCHACNAPFQDFKHHFEGIGLWQRNKNTPVAIAKPAKVAEVKPNGLLSRNASTYSNTLWLQALPIHNTQGERYLKTRGINPTGYADSLRFHPALKHTPSEEYFPAIIAKISTVSGEFTGVHRTYLAPDGLGKAPVTPNKMMLGASKGGTVQLNPFTGNTLAVTEGIETGLSVLQATGIPTWATLSTAGMQTMILPPLLSTLIICADHDEAGIKAATALCDRATQHGIAVKLAIPPTYGTDFNDLLLKEELPA